MFQKLITIFLIPLLVAGVYRASLQSEVSLTEVFEIECGNDPEGCLAVGGCLTQQEINPYSISLWYDIPKPLRAAVVERFDEARRLNQSLTESELEEIRGVGEKRKAKLLNYICFGTEPNEKIRELPSSNTVIVIKRST